MKLKYMVPVLSLAFACGDDEGGKEKEQERIERVVIHDAAVETYAVEGSDCEEAGEDMSSKGFIKDGERFAGKTEWWFGFECVYNPVPEEPDVPRKEFCCNATVEDLVTVCDATVYLPEWDGSDKCWDQFINALTVHEQGHVDICQDYKGRLNDALEGLESRMCSLESMQKACDDALEDLEQKADGEYGRVDGEHENAQDAYDSETNHGETQGAVLDCDCE